MVDAAHPTKGDVRTYIWTEKGEGEPHWHCPDPFHSPNEDTITPENATERGDFARYRKTALSRVSTFTVPPGTRFKTPEGLHAEDEECRIAFDSQGGVYPIRESVFQESYEPAFIEPPSEPKIVNVKDFGAVGDGEADDAPAIQAAIDSLASEPIDWERKRADADLEDACVMLIEDGSPEYAERIKQVQAALEQAKAEAERVRFIASETYFKAGLLARRGDELSEAVKRWRDSGIEATHPLRGQQGCPHCEAEAALDQFVAAWDAARGKGDG